MKKELFISEKVAPYFKHELNACMKDVFSMEGDVYRHVENRKTFRIEKEGKGYFVKTHGGVGWKEIIKNITSGRLPIIGAKTEYSAIRCCEHLGLNVPHVVAFGRKGCNPATQRSFLVTEDLGDTISLEALGEQWVETPPAFQEKRRLIKKVADVARTFHQAGMNHRDFYACHFLLTPSDDIALIDLHRVQRRKRVPRRWQIKDLAGLYFSVMPYPLTTHDFYYFIRCYRQASLKTVFKKEGVFWKAVARKASALYRKHSPIQASHAMKAPFLVPLATGGYVKATDVLRVLPGKRLVVKGIWQGRAVIAKIFVQPYQASRHITREVRGLTCLHEAHLPAPHVLSNTTVRANSTIKVLLVECIEPAQSLNDAFKKANISEKETILCDMMRLIADMHQVGLIQHDFHLDNVLVSNGKYYLIDSGELMSSSVTPREMLNNVAFFLSQLMAITPEMLEKAYAAYMTHYFGRDSLYMRPTQKALENMQSRINGWMAWRHETYMEKCERECTRFVKRQTKRYTVMYERGLFESADVLFHLIKTPSFEYEGKSYVVETFETKEAAKQQWLTLHSQTFYDDTIVAPVALVMSKKFNVIVAHA